MKNMCCNKKTCGCNKTVNYCGSFLACSGIENGDTFDEVVKKLNAVACDDANTEYSFSENEECENGGFIVTDSDGLEVYNICFPEKGEYFFEENEECENSGFVVKNADEEVVFSACYPCCGGGMLTFEENEECENGGFIIKDEEDNLVYSFCSECCSGCDMFYVSNHEIISEGSFDMITLNIEGGSGNYSYELSETRIVSTHTTTVDIDGDSGVITIGGIMPTQPNFQIFMLVTVKDLTKGCVAQYPIYYVTGTREG